MVIDKGYLLKNIDNIDNIELILVQLELDLV